MSRRSFPKCVAAGLLAAVVSPALAQSPNPWRTGREVAPEPRPVVRVGVEFEFDLPPRRAAKPAPPPDVQASMLKELERMGAQTTAPSWNPAVPPMGTAVTLPPAVGQWVGGFQTYAPGGRQLTPQDYTRNFPQYFPADPQHFPGGTPRPAAATSTPACPPPVVLSDAGKEAFEQLVSAGVNTLFRVLPTRTYTRGMTLPSPRYLVEHPPQPTTPAPAFPLLREPSAPQRVVASSYTPPPAQLVAPARAGPVGSWHRSAGPVAYTVVVKDEYLTVTTKVAIEGAGGEKFTTCVVLTGDYHVSRDGSNLVGIITSVTATPDDAQRDGDQFEHVVKTAAKLNKGFTDKPFAVSFRVYDGALAIGNVRLPQCDDADLNELFAAAGGQFFPVSSYPPPPPAASNPKAAPSAIVPVGGVPKVRGVQSSPDPSTRMKQLLFQSEDHRQIEKSWRDYWFRDPPHHMTPERIHGGIF